MRRLMLLLLAVLCSGCLGGKNRVVYVKDSEPARLRGTIVGAKVWAKDAAGNDIPAEKDLQEGSYNVTR